MAQNSARSAHGGALVATGGDLIDQATLMASVLLEGLLGDDDARHAEAALTRMLDGPETAPREALARLLGGAAEAPRHLVRALAQDRPEIARHVLAASPHFLDIELAQFVRDGAPALQLAIAGRERPGPAVIGALAAHGCAEAALRMLEVHGNRLDQATLLVLVERFGSSAAFRTAIASLAPGPVVRLALIDAVAAEAREAEGASRLLDARHERAVVTLASHVEDAELGALVDALLAQRRLHSAMLVRVVLAGQLTFLSVILARLTGLAPARVEAVLTAARSSTLRALGRRAGLAPATVEVLLLCLLAWHEVMGRLDTVPVEDVQAAVASAVLADYRGPRDRDADPLLALLRQLADEAERERMRASVPELRPLAAPLLAAPVTLAAAAADEDGAADDTFAADLAEALRSLDPLEDMVHADAANDTLASLREDADLALIAGLVARSRNAKAA